MVTNQGQPKNRLKQRIVIALLMGIVPTGVVSFLVMWMNFGFSETFLRTWLRSWSIAYVIMVPIIFILAPVVDRLVAFLFKEKEDLD
jgi:hypothetical protein